MLAIAGVITWLGYTVLTYGLSQLAGGNYTIGDLAIPGRFKLGNPAPDPPSENQHIIIYKTYIIHKTAQ